MHPKMLAGQDIVPIRMYLEGRPYVGASRFDLELVLAGIRYQGIDERSGDTPTCELRRYDGVLSDPSPIAHYPGQSTEKVAAGNVSSVLAGLRRTTARDCQAFHLQANSASNVRGKGGYGA